MCKRCHSYKFADVTGKHTLKLSISIPFLFQFLTYLVKPFQSQKIEKASNFASRNFISLSFLGLIFINTFAINLYSKDQIIIVFSEKV